jgi:uncharacterized membrane protein YvbJ
MGDSYFDCPFCGQKLMKGAMKCVGCGKMLKTADEQQASIQKLKESPRGFDFTKALKFIIFLVGLALIYHFFSDQITEIFNNLLKK